MARTTSIAREVPLEGCPLPIHTGSPGRLGAWWAQQCGGASDTERSAKEAELVVLTALLECRRLRCLCRALASVDDVRSLPLFVEVVLEGARLDAVDELADVVGSRPLAGTKPTTR
jgi:hypothetical protein